MTTDPVIERYFVCIGAQKSGTTWLARMLARHDDVYVTPVKEIHYFDHAAGLTDQLSDRKRRSRYRKYHQRMWTQWHRWRLYRAQADWYRAYMQPDLNDAWYASLFAERDGKVIAGEVTPEYALIGPKGMRHMKKLAPDARIIYIMRNPVDRAWSQLLHQCRVRNLDASVLAVDDFLAIATEERFAALADYSRVLDDLAAEFPASQVLLEFYEDIHANREAAMRRVCDFLGVGFDKSHASGLEQRFNTSQVAALPDALRTALTSQYADMKEEVQQRVGRVPDSW